MGRMRHIGPGVVLTVMLACLVGWGVCGPVGSTSHWGIVVSPCAWCGGTNDIEVHHVIPQEECRRMGRLDLIRDTNNMVCLCRTDGKGCHFYIGHHGITWDYVFTNVMAVIKASKK